MKKSTFSNVTTAIILSSGICMLPVNVSANVPTAIASPTADDCSRELLMAYFPKPFVEDTLGRFNVPKDQWDAISKELAEKDKDIVKTVETKASKMNPNPLTDPQQRQAAVKLFRETLLESFSTVLKAHGVKDDKQIQAMLDDVQQQKAKRFAKCMAPPQGQPANKPMMSAPGSSAEKDIDDTDGDDD